MLKALCIVNSINDTRLADKPCLIEGKITLQILLKVINLKPTKRPGIKQFRDDDFVMRFRNNAFLELGLTIALDLVLVVKLWMYLKGHFKVYVCQF